ncbi:hypothetical protein DIPPA_07482 [Diplonema papillatum]|nr:hypothetical protein DIPPA_07482 [Diplonema papillatum]
MGDSKLLVYFDGGTRANGTAFAVAGAGAVVYRDGVKVAEVVLPLPAVRSNNVAEYEGLLAGLHLLGNAGEAEGEECTVRGDSALVVGHLTRRMACSEELKPYLTRATLMVSSLQRRLTMRIEHVARERNVDADALSNAAMDLVQSRRPTRQQQETMLANFRRSGLGKALSLVEMGKAYRKVVAQPWFCGHEYSTTVLTSVGGTVVRGVSRRAQLLTATEDVIMKIRDHTRESRPEQQENSPFPPHLEWAATFLPEELSGRVDAGKAGLEGEG